MPKGLRSFDAQDADFLLDLLPGPRDRFSDSPEVETAFRALYLQILGDDEKVVEASGPILRTRSANVLRPPISSRSSAGEGRDAPAPRTMSVTRT